MRAQVTYSISGIAWFAQASLFTALLLVLLFPKRRERRPPICRTLGLVGLALGLGLLLLDHVLREDGAHLAALHSNIWLGGVLPFSVGWAFREWHRFRLDAGSPYGIVHAHSVLLLATPSLTMLSVTCLSLMFFYFPMVVPAAPRNTTTKAEEDPLLVELVLNASRVYYEWVVSPSSHSLGVVALGAPRTLSDVVTAMCALPLMWTGLTIVVGCGLRVPSRACSTVGVYLLSALLVRLLVMDWGPAAVVGLVLCKLSVGCLMHAELRQMERVALQEGLMQAEALTRCFSPSSLEPNAGGGEGVGPLDQRGGAGDEE